MTGCFLWTFARYLDRKPPCATTMNGKDEMPDKRLRFGNLRRPDSVRDASQENLLTYVWGL